MASSSSSLICASTPSLRNPQLASSSSSSSRDHAPLSQFSSSALCRSSRACIGLQPLHRGPPIVSGGESFGNYAKKSSWVCAQLHTCSSPMPSVGASFGSRSPTRSSWVLPFSSAETSTTAGNMSSSSLARELSHFTQTSFHFERTRRRKRSRSPRLAASQKNEAKIETEPEIGNKQEEKDESLASREATAAVTVAAVASDVEAISKVLETVEEQEEEEATGEDSAAAAAGASYISEELEAIYAKCQQWQWKNNYSINYMVQGSGPPVVLVHGFGASIGHWRRNIGVLSETNTVYAIDLLGLGASAKPTKFNYTMETWAELLIDFLKEIVGSPGVLVGNSIGSLACLIASAEAPAGLVRGTVLLNCAGGMNNKAITEDWRLKLAVPVLWLIDFLLSQPSIAARLFKRIRTRANIKNVLQSVYNNKAAVDDELVEVILRPADTAGALDAFVSIITGPPGPKPQSLMPKISTPVLLIWGDDDPFTPINGPVGKYFAALSTTAPNVQLYLLPNVGHCPHDDRPDLVHEKLVPWLASLPV